VHQLIWLWYFPPFFLWYLFWSFILLFLLSFLCLLSSLPSLLVPFCFLLPFYPTFLLLLSSVLSHFFVPSFLSCFVQSYPSPLYILCLHLFSFPSLFAFFFLPLISLASFFALFSFFTSCLLAFFGFKYLFCFFFYVSFPFVLLCSFLCSHFSEFSFHCLFLSFPCLFLSFLYLFLSTSARLHGAIPQKAAIFSFLSVLELSLTAEVFDSEGRRVWSSLLSCPPMYIAVSCLYLTLTFDLEYCTWTSL
jgi:hypothetical protein